MAQTWDNRIVRRADVDPAALFSHPLNFRRHTKAQKDAFRGLVKQVGFIDPILARDSDGVIIDGHLRVEVALEDGIATVPVDYYAGTDAESDLILATKDPLAAMAFHDAEALDALMRDLVVDDPAVAAMLADLAGGNDAYAEPPPPPDEDRYKEQYGVIVICRDAAHQEAVYAELQGAGHECRVVVT